MGFNSILLFIHESLGQDGRMMLGSDDPIIQGLILSMFVVSGFGHGSWKQTSNWEDVVGNYMSKLGFAEFKLR